MDKTHELARSDDTQLVEGLLDKTVEHARKTVLDSQRTACITNQPVRFNRASALKGLLVDVPLEDDGESTVVGSTAEGPSSSRLNNAAALTPFPSPAQIRSSCAARMEEEAARDANDGQTHGHGAGLLGVLSSIRAQAPKAPDAAGKKKAQPKPKKGANKNQDKSGNNKENEEDEENPRKRKASLVESMKPPEISKAASNQAKASGCSVADCLSGADKEWYESMLAKVVSLLKVHPDSDEEARSIFNEAQRESMRLLKIVRARGRSVKRRTPENMGNAPTDAADLENKLELLNSLMKLLLKPSSGECGNIGDESYCKICKLEDLGADFGIEVYKVVARHMFTDDLRWKRWDSMSEVTCKFVKRALPTEGVDSFVTQNLNVCLQKLLKAVPLDVVAWRFQDSASSCLVTIL